jgi:hypothetical protein
LRSPLTNASDTASDSSTPITAMRLALRPSALASPRKNCVPYWMPTVYRKRARPKAPTIGAGADFGANHPIASAMNSTAPAPNERPLKFTSPSR